MHWLLATAGIAAMTAALARGDLDEVARQGALAGPRVVEAGLHSHDRTEQLAAIAAAPAVADREELLPALARVASGADRRTAIPAARSALAIAKDLARRDLPDDLAPDDVDGWRSRFEGLARAPDHPIEVRVLALETAHALARGGLGFALAPLLADPDPDLMLDAAAIACSDHRAEVAALADRVRALAADRATARDVLACIQ